MRRVSISAFVLICASVILCAAEETAPKSTPNGNEMPLALYQKLKGHFDDLYGAKVDLLPGVAPVDKGAIEKELKADASANKAVLVKALGSSQALQRELAARALEYSGDKSAAVEALGKALVDDADESVRRAAATALAKMPDAAAEDALIKALGDSVETVRALSARALGNIKDTRATEGLLRAVNGDSASMVRMQAAVALKKIKDPKSLEGLKKALDTEKDENVKLVVAGAVRDLMGGDSPETAEMPSAEEAAGQLGKLATDMKSVEEKLRGDRHDQAVQVDGANIEKNLATMIEKLEKACNSSSNGNKEGEKQQSQKQQNGNQGANAQNGKQDSKAGGNVPHGATNAAQVGSTMDSWAKLPPAQRDELLQAFREEVPERWRKRLEAYFLSVNAEENKESEK